MTASRILFAIFLLEVSMAVLNSHHILTNDLQWLEESCSEDSDCVADFAVCFKGKCLCQPGFYYSRTKNICLDMCAEVHQIPR